MSKDIPSQIHDLQAKLEQLRALQFEELREKLRVARKVVADLEAEIATLTGKSTTGVRKRTARLKWVLELRMPWRKNQRD